MVGHPATAVYPYMVPILVGRSGVPTVPATVPLPRTRGKRRDPEREDPEEERKGGEFEMREERGEEDPTTPVAPWRRGAPGRPCRPGRLGRSG